MKCVDMPELMTLNELREKDREGREGVCVRKTEEMYGKEIS
jgi:hypothetical protein